MSEQPGDGAHYDVSPPQPGYSSPRPEPRPEPRPVPRALEDDDLDLPPMPPKPQGPHPQAQAPEPAAAPDSGPGDEPPPGAEVPDLETILRMSQGITPDFSGAIRSMAGIHAEWRQAWAETGQFSEAETFELVRILVATSAGGISSLD